MNVAAILTTDANGRVTFNYATAGFTAIPSVVACVVDPNTSDTVWYDVQLESVSTTQAVARVFTTAAVTVLSISVLAAAAPAGAGRTVHVIAVQP